MVDYHATPAGPPPGYEVGKIAYMELGYKQADVDGGPLADADE